MQTIHFFRAGKHKTAKGHELTFSERDLSAIAASYDPRTHEAPIVVGHPKANLPAYGWIERIIAKPDGLHAVPRQVNPEFAELVQQGAFKKVSAAFYSPADSSNPKPGAHYLRHIGFLGAEPPAVKGLSAVEFSEAEDVVFSEEDISALRDHTHNTRERALERRELNNAIKQAQVEGRIPVGLMPGVLAFAESLTHADEITFSENGEDVSFGQAQFFADFVSKLPVPVILGEVCGGEFSEGEDDFIAPPGYSVNREMADLNRAVSQHMRQHGTSLGDAVKAVQAAGRR